MFETLETNKKFYEAEKIYEALRNKELLDDILKLILDSSKLNYDDTKLTIYYSERLFDYIELKFEDKYNERLAQLKNEKALKE